MPRSRSRTACRLLLATGEGKYGDLVERLAPIDSAPRRPWFQPACCPPNVSRFLAALGGFYYAMAPDAVSALRTARRGGGFR